MRADTKDRVNTEAELYDNQKLQRDRFETALTDLNEGIGRLRRNEAIRAAMRDATGMRVLEVGSQSWAWCLYRYGYRPEQLTCINISETELEFGRAQAAKLGVSCDFRKMDAHELEFADGSLDLVYGLPFCITSSSPARCAKSTGFFEKAERSCLWNRCAIIRSPVWCAGSPRTRAPLTNCRSAAANSA
jgi:Methyltransferase domain